MSYAAEIMVMFLIMNTTSCLVPGALLFGYGVGTEVLTGSQSNAPKGQIVAGLLLMFFAAIGYCGAISQNKRKLSVYSVAMLLPLVIEIVGVSLGCKASPGLSGDGLKVITIDCMLLIAHILLMVLSIGLSVTLHVKIVVTEVASLPQALAANNKEERRSNSYIVS